MTMADLEKQGYRFSLEGGAVRVRRYGAPLDRSLLASLDRQQVISALRDRAAGFKPVEPQILERQYGQIDELVHRIKAALEDGSLWDARVQCHRGSGRIVFLLTPPGVIE